MYFLIDMRTKEEVESHVGDYWDFIDNRWGGMFPFLNWSNGNNYYFCRNTNRIHGVQRSDMFWSPLPWNRLDYLYKVKRISSTSVFGKYLRKTINNK